VNVVGQLDRGTTINLLRLVSKINVGVSVESGLTLEGVRLYNRNQSGLLIPSVDALASDGKRVTSVSLPLDPLKSSLEDSQAYPVYEGAVENTIYTFEALAGEVGGENPSLVLSLSKDGGDARWYRAEFVSADGSYLPLLRNYTYNIVITGVSGIGSSDPDVAALESPLSPSEAVVTHSDPSGVSAVSYDGLYSLTLSANEISFYREGGTTELLIESTYSGGWSLSSSPASWLTVTPASGEADVPASITIKADPFPSSLNVSRSDTLRFTSGSIVSLVTVTQGIESNVTLSLSSEILEFSRSPGSYQTLSVIASGGAKVRISKVLGSEKGVPILYRSEYDPVLSEGGEVRIWPLSKSDDAPSEVTYRVEVADKVSTFMIRQSASDILFTDINLPEYDPSVPSGSVEVKYDIASGARWWLTLLSNPDDMLTLSPGVVAPGVAPSLSPIKTSLFTIKNNPGYVARTAYVGVLSDDPNWGGQTLKVTQLGTPLKLDLGSTPLDIDVDGTLPDIKLRTNANWTFTTGSDTLVLLKSVNGNPWVYDEDGLGYAPDHASALDVDDITATIKLVAADKTKDLQAAGSVIESYIEFSSLLADVPPIVKRIRLHRLAQARWDESSVVFETSEEILPAEDATVEVTAETNASWSLESSTGEKVELPAEAYGTKTLSLPLDVPSPSRRLTVTVNGPAGLSSLTHSYIQRGSLDANVNSDDFVEFESINLTGDSIAADGRSVTIRLKGEYIGLLMIRVLADGVPQNDPSDFTNYDGSPLSVWIPANTTTSPREISFVIDTQDRALRIPGELSSLKYPQKAGR
jgi:enamine deaminase RidA (YjgF/YER057c/UK114 family)